MKTFDRVEIETDPDRLGRRKVWGVTGTSMRSAGYLMPQLKDSRQQPKSLAYTLTEERARERTSRSR